MDQLLMSWVWLDIIADVIIIGCTVGYILKQAYQKLKAWKKKFDRHIREGLRG